MTLKLSPSDIQPIGPWIRAGRGRSFETFATVDDLDDWAGPVIRNSDLVIVRFDLVESSHHEYAARLAMCDGHSLAACSRTTQTIPVSLWLVARTAVQDLTATPSADLLSLLSYNGFILVQHGAAAHGREKPVLVSLVDRVKSRSTGDTIVHEESLSRYRELVSRAKRAIVAASRWEVAPGQYVEDRSIGFTARALDLYRTGHPYAADPTVLPPASPEVPE